MSFSFIHMADVHLDTPYAGRPELRTHLRSMLREAFVQAIDLAITRRVDAVLIAGDLYDSENLSYSTAALISAQFRRLLEKGIAVLYAPGNHDPMGAAARLSLPRGVEVFEGPQPRAVEVVGPEGMISGIVVGAGYSAGQMAGSVIDDFPQRYDDLPTVGLLHTQLTDIAGPSPYAPCSLAQLEEKGYDYWALGHIHAAQSFGGGRVVYPGCLCGRDYSESGEKGVWLVSIDDMSGVKARLQPIPAVTWLDVTADGLKDISDLQSLEDTLVSRVQAASFGGGERMIRIRLEGEFGMYDGFASGALETGENLAAITHGLSARVQALDVLVETGDIRPPVDVEKWQDMPHVVSEILSLVKDAREDDAKLEELMRVVDKRCPLYGGRQPDYVRSLLEGMEELIIRRLVKEDAR